MTISQVQQKKIFISYKRAPKHNTAVETNNAENQSKKLTDEIIAEKVYEELSRHYDVFRDQENILVGMEWAKIIEQEISKSQFLIVFLSANSVHSEMVRSEIEMARDNAKERGYPVILPIRLAYDEALKHPLNAYLNHINWAIWDSEDDTTRLIEELKRAIEGQKLPSPPLIQDEPDNINPIQYVPLPKAPIESPGGAMSPDSEMYIERKIDSIALKLIAQPDGVTMTVKGPKQVGKSSLMARVKEAAERAEKQVINVDFRRFDKSVLRKGDRFFQEFCQFLTLRLKVDSCVENYWKRKVGNVMRCSFYLEEYLLPSLNKPLVLIIDEVDKLFDSPFRDDFFSMLRNWHNDRALEPVWERLDIALVTSTEPHLFIEDDERSPFNVGEVLEPEDFTIEQIRDLHMRYGKPLEKTPTGRNGEGEKRLFELLHGHPFLTRRALYLIANEQLSCEDFFNDKFMTSDESPFGDHLRNFLFLIYKKKELVDGFLTIIGNQRCKDERIFERLRGAGLVRRENGYEVPRCALYAKYFKEHLQ